MTILALAAPIFGEENAEVKRQEKRGVVGVGYGGHYPAILGAHGLSGYGGYGAFGGKRLGSSLSSSGYTVHCMRFRLLDIRSEISESLEPVYPDTLFHS